MGGGIRITAGRPMVGAVQHRWSVPQRKADASFGGPHLPFYIITITITIDGRAEPTGSPLCHWSPGRCGPSLVFRCIRCGPSREALIIPSISIKMKIKIYV